MLIKKYTKVNHYEKKAFFKKNLNLKGIQYLW